MTSGKDVGDGQDGPIVEFLSTRDMPQGRSALAEIEAHWRDLWARAGGHLPRRADLDASRIASALPHAFILEKAAPGVARLRIAGRALAGMVGTEPRGMPLSVLFSPASRDGLQSWLERCFAVPALVELPVEAPQGPFRQPVTGRLLLLPMLDQDGEITRALGGLFLDLSPRRLPIRFDIRDSATRCERIVPRTPAVLRVGGSAPRLRESERPYLRLVVSNPRP